MIELNPTLKKIDDLLEQEQYGSALETIQGIKGTADISTYKNTILDRERAAISGLAAKNFDDGMVLYKANSNEKAKTYFDAAFSLIYSNIELFNFNKEIIDKIISDIPQHVNYAYTACDFGVLDQFREGIIDIANENFKGQYEGGILIILLESVLLSETIGGSIKTIDYIPPLFRWFGNGTSIYGNTLYFTIIWIPVIPLARYSVRQVKSGFFSDQYEFFGKLELHRWQKVWQYLVLIILAVWICIFFVYSKVA